MAEHDPTDPELTPAERGLLDAWEPAAPPAGFADRVIAAQAAQPTPVADPASPSPWRGRGVTVASAVVATACLGALGLAVVRGTRATPAPLVGAATGEVDVTSRRRVALGGRALAVAEAGASLTWSIAGDSARVEQSRGDVFYRVEPGGAFVVHTPDGDVRVTGTCFRIELPTGSQGDSQENDMTMTTKKAGLIGGTLGAALAAVAVISVYEGGVVVANTQGQVAAKDGQRVEILAGSGPVVVEGARGTGGAGAAAIAAMTRDQLTAEVMAKQREIARLTDAITQARSGAGAPGGAGGPGVRGGGPPDDGDGRPWFDPSPELLLEWAKDCHIRVDMPSGSGTPEIALEEGEAYGLSAAEVVAVNAVLATWHATWSATVRALYLEATGDAAGADTLSLDAMAQEILDKSAPGESDAIRGRIANERAGLTTPPADLSKTTPVERYVRGQAAQGDEAERAIAKVIGPERARALRGLDRGPFGMKMELAGCGDEP